MYLNCYIYILYIFVYNLFYLNLYIKNFFIQFTKEIHDYLNIKNKKKQNCNITYNIVFN
jgi:hypothetical protein